MSPSTASSADGCYDGLCGQTMRLFSLRHVRTARKATFTAILPCLTAAVFFFALPAQAQVEYVDPTIGNVGILLEPTRPAVYLPNSMVRMYPIRHDALDDRIQGFPLTISSHRISELFRIMPGDGLPAAYEQETTTPYFYS